MRRHFLSVIFLAVGLFAVSARAAELVMVEQSGCAWCAKWDREIAEIYPKTPEGQAAPLRRVDIHDLPAALSTAHKVVFTPTFILTEDGAELARIEGYPGEDFFWGLLGKMLKENTNFEGES